MKRISLIAAFIVALLFSPAYAQGRTGAVCRDGTTSGATGRGACSHHGGVDHWITSDPEVTPTFTPIPTVAPIPTATPSPIPTLAKKTVTIVQPTSTATITATGAISGTSAIVLRDANLRAGPGTSYAIAGAAKAGQVVKIIGQNSDASWYHLAGGQWIAAFLVELTGEVKPATNAGTIVMPTPTRVIQVSIKDDPAVKTYAASMQVYLTLCGEGTNIVSSHFTQASSNIYLMLDKDWRNGIAVGVADFRLCSTGIQRLQPPALFSDVHKDLLTLANHIDRLATLVTEGVDNLDSAKITAVGQEFDFLARLSNTIHDKISALNLQ